MHKKQENFMPNIIVWAWMRTVLGLVGTEILIFSYVYSQTFDSVHKCYTPLCDMEKWFGITRQTISRNIERLESKGYIIKEIHEDTFNKMIKHNSYQVNMSVVSELCEKSDYDSYKNFLDSYSFVLKNSFPQCSGTIDEYLNTMLQWHQTKDITVKVKLNDLAEVLESKNSDCSISDIINSITCKRKPKEIAPKASSQKPKSDKLFGEQKKKSTRITKNEWMNTKQQMTKEFVFMRAGGNLDLLNAICDFLSTKNGQSYSPTQWENQLDNLYKYGRTVERMIDGVRNSFMNNYRALYIVDKSEIDIDKKLSEIDKYVSNNGNNEDLKKWLCLYVTEVPKGKSSTITQFKLMLENLDAICKTESEKVESVKVSYTNSYSALAYKAVTNSSDNTSVEVDMEEKETLVQDFIKTGYYQLCDGLEQSLFDYIHNTPTGKGMSKDKFEIALNNLRLFCLTDDEKVNKVKFSILANKPYLATEDFDETKKLKSRLETRETMATSMDRSRKLRVEQEKLKHPDDPRLKDVVVQKRTPNIV